MTVMKRYSANLSRFVAVLLVATLALAAAASVAVAASPNPIPSRYAAIIIDALFGWDANRFLLGAVNGLVGGLVTFRQLGFRRGAAAPNKTP